MNACFAERGGVRLHYRVEGARDAPPIVLLNSIGTDITLWDGVCDRLATRHCLLRIDTRGHGRSSANDGDYDMAMLADDLRTVLDQAGVDRPIIAGVSLGGMIAMHFASVYLDRVRALLPICTSVTMDSDAWRDRVTLVRSGGMEAIADLAMNRFLSKSFRAKRPEVANHIRERLLNMDARGYAGCGAAIRDLRLRDQLGKIGCPTVVVSGQLDNSTPFLGHGEHLVAGIDGARHHALRCGHLAPVECPEELAAIIAAFAFEVGRSEQVRGSRI